MITIYNAQGTKIIDVANLEGSYCDRSIMGGSTLQLVVKSDKPIDIPLNSYVEYEARRYTLLYPASIKKQHSKEFDYTLLFHGEEELLSSCLIKDISGGIPYRVKFAITAKPIDFVRCIVDSLNEHYGGGWSVGNVIEATEQTLAFSHEYCLGAISRVAEVFNTEFSVDNKTVSLGKVSIMEDNPLPMSYGNGKGFRPGTGRHNDGKKSAIGKLYVEGGTRNIDYSTYGAQTLLLPKSATLQYNGRTYHTDAHGMYITCDQAIGTAEDSYDGSAVYPMREGTVSEVIEEADGYDFTDTSIPESLNFNDYRIKGEKAVVVFQTGALTGREFALVQTKGKLSGYIHSERKFKLVSEEQDGFMMPGGNFVPKEGDKYAIFNITLPAEYLSNASQRLFEEAVRYFDTVINPPYIFSGEVDPIWAKKEWLRIGGYMQPGGHLLFSDPQYHPEGSVIRVTGVRTLLDKPYAPQLTLSNAPAALSVSNALSKLEADKVIAERERRAQQRSQRQDYQQALEFIGMVEKAIEGLEGFTARIKPSVVETMAILIGSQATQFGFVQAINSLEAAPFSVNYDPSTKRVIISKGIIRHQTIGITDMTANRPATDYRYWSIPEYISPALTDDFASYYIYAKVDRNGQTGNYLLSEKPIEMESDSLSYHLLIGTLSSIVDGDRAYNKLYGYSLFTPGQMVLNTISSTNGAMTINLETGEIYSDAIHFRRPDTQEETNLIDYIDEVDTHHPIIKNGTWWRWDGTQYVDTGEPAQGADGKDGKDGLQGLQGKDGKDGLPGRDGKDGKTQYTHIAYANNASGGGFSQSPTGKAYIGMYVDFVATDSSDPKKYKWSLIKGADGRDGIAGKAGKDGRTPYLHIAYANSSDGRQGFSVSDSQGKTYIGTYTDFVKADSTDPTQYKWTLIKGRDGRDGKDGKDGLQGLQGKDGKDGLPGRDGKDGKTQYTHIAYANNASGGGFSQSPTGKAYIGMYVDFVQEDSSDHKKYKWSLIKGADGRNGTPGKAGADGRTPYLHIAYATSADGKKGFSTTVSAGKTYIGTYTDFVKADSTTPSDYKWTLIKGKKGDRGPTGPKGDGLDVKDTRNDNQLPNWYRKNYRYTTVKEFKFQGVIEIPKVWRDGSYCTLETTVNWGDKSGGRVTQKATLNSGQELYRVGSADDSAWGEWSNLKAEVQEINAGLSNANTLISSIETITKQLKEGKLDASKFDDIRYLTDALQHGETTIAGGLLLTKSILMSNKDDEITTAISGYSHGGGVAFEAGIKNYKQENHTSRVVINHDGSARFGDMYLNADKEDVVKFVDQSSGENHEYLKFGGTAPSESYMNDQSTVIKEFPMPSVRAENKSGEFLIVKEDESIESNREIRHEIELTATAEAVATREDLNSGGLSIMSARSAYELGSDRGDRIINYLPAWANSTAHVEVKVYNKSGVVVWSDTSTKVTASAHAKGCSVSYTEILPLEDIQDVQTQTKKVYMRIPANVMVKGYKWRVYLVVNGSASDRGSSYRAYTNAGKEFVPYDLSKPFVALAKDRVAFFFGRQRQILFNYLSNWVVKIVGDVLVQGTLKADILEADEWKGSGAVLAGAMFDENGKELKGFGKYKNRAGMSSGSTVYSYNSKLYTVYHSIPHSRYVPVVQVSGETGNNGGWSLTPRVYSVSAYSFTVGIITNGDNKTRNGLSYVAYQAD
ncbi:hypothetical protein QYZ87_08420 [Porphyromonadaceae bacterium W3.11]|nr:hypothetical protein [Porphyromonadaceae bacterium W3.11]